MPISLEKVEGMLEDWGSALDAVVHPRGAKLLFVEGDGGSLATDDGHAFDDGHLVFIWVLGEGVCAGLLVLVSCEAREKERLLLTMPAAPPPMMTTFFLPFLRSSSEDMITVGSWV